MKLLRIINCEISKISQDLNNFCSYEEENGEIKYSDIRFNESDANYKMRMKSSIDIQAIYEPCVYSGVKEYTKLEELLNVKIYRLTFDNKPIYTPYNVHLLMEIKDRLNTPDFIHPTNEDIRVWFIDNETSIAFVNDRWRDDVNAFIVPVIDYWASDGDCYNFGELEFMKQSELADHKKEHRNNPQLLNKNGVLKIWKPCDWDGFDDEVVDIKTIYYNDFKNHKEIDYRSESMIEKRNMICVLLISQCPDYAPNWTKGYVLPDKNGWHYEYWAELLRCPNYDKASEIQFKMY